MFIDEAEIKVIGGHGGAGRVAFFANRRGPSGGDGGHGGSVYVQITSNLTHLKKFTEITKYKAEDGGRGGQNRSSGLDGRKLILYVPVGTTLIDKKTGEEIVLNINSGQTLLCEGGLGGHGNAFFKNSTHQIPTKAQPGLPGRERNFKLILKLIADFGLIGLPNAGKSSLLNMLTAANVKTASYPFTTLEPNLGVYNGKVIADVPGLIEGASSGKGLGIKFLKHIEKVNLIFHCISVESPDVIGDYKTVQNELKSYNLQLIDKKSVILLTKIDLVDEKAISEKLALLKKISKNVLPITIYDEKTLDRLKRIISP